MLQRIQAGSSWVLHDVVATRRIEHAAQAQLPPHALMQHAGLAVARLAAALAPHAQTIWIACGAGNNGGDGLQAAAHLKQWGFRPVVSWLGTAQTVPDDARVSHQCAVQAGVQFSNDVPRLTEHDLAIDALLGIGATRAPQGRMAQWLKQMHSCPATVLSVDVPSGLNADTGTLYLPFAEPLESTTCDELDPSSNGRMHTLTLLTLKPGLWMTQGRDACGQVWFDDLGVASSAESPTALLNPLPPAGQRLHASHKGSFGDVAVIGGQTCPEVGTSMSGAVILAASAALHGGAGRVYVATLGENLSHCAEQPELMFRRPDTLDLKSLTVVCGCGGGSAVAQVLPPVIHQSHRLVLDADALNAVAQEAGLIQDIRARAERNLPTVLTPHPMEAARLLDTNARDIQLNRLDASRALVERFQATVVLKGSGTIIAAPHQLPQINPCGNARLACAGTGDVLAGLIGAKMAAGKSSFEAACASVFLHGQAADVWPRQRALTAARLARALTPA